MRKQRNIESYLLERYEELTRELFKAENVSEYDTIFHMRKEITTTLLECGI